MFWFEKAGVRDRQIWVSWISDTTFNLLRFSKKENTRLIMQQWTQNQYILTKWLTEEDVQGALQAAEEILEEKAKSWNEA